MGSGNRRRQPRRAAPGSRPACGYARRFRASRTPARDPRARGSPRGHAIDVGILYDAVAGGMLAYSRAAFRVRVLSSSFRFEPGTMIVSTHRRETDVPLICPPLYFRGSVWRYRWPRMSFAARDDMFLPGFFAGFPPDLSPRARRILYPLGVARWLPVVQVHPIRSASVARL